jgi:hypothetical protein
MHAGPRPDPWLRGLARSAASRQPPGVHLLLAGVEMTPGFKTIWSSGESDLHAPSPAHDWSDDDLPRKVKYPGLWRIGRTRAAGSRFERSLHARRGILERHGHEPDDPEVEAAWTLAAFEIMHESPPSFADAFSISMDVATTKIAPMLDGLHWHVEITDAPVLWASDRPVMQWRPPSIRDRFEGVGYGDCDEIRMPLTPTAMLILERKASRSPRRVDSARFYRYNEDSALQCYEFVVCTPGRRERLARIPLASRRPAVRFHTAPGVQVAPDGTRSPMGDVIHKWIPLRSVDPLPPDEK